MRRRPIGCLTCKGSGFMNDLQPDDRIAAAICSRCKGYGRVESYNGNEQAALERLRREESERIRRSNADFRVHVAGLR
jgi:DnaJ-class molecular chaperone